MKEHIRCHSKDWIDRRPASHEEQSLQEQCFKSTNNITNPSEKHDTHSGPAYIACC